MPIYIINIFKCIRRVYIHSQHTNINRIAVVQLGYVQWTLSVLSTCRKNIFYIYIFFHATTSTTKLLDSLQKIIISDIPKYIFEKSL